MTLLSPARGRPTDSQTTVIEALLGSGDAEREIANDGEVGASSIYKPNETPVPAASEQGVKQRQKVIIVWYEIRDYHTNKRYYQQS